MNQLQLFLLMQNQCMVLRLNMTITAPNKGLGRVKREFKQMMDLAPKCSDVETLQNIGILYAMNGEGKKFNDYMDDFNMEKHGIEHVIESSVEEQQVRLN